MMKGAVKTWVTRVFCPYPTLPPARVQGQQLTATCTYFLWQRLPSGWCWGDQTAPWCSLLPKNLASVFPCSPPSAFWWPPETHAFPAASASRCRLPQIHLQTKSRKHGIAKERAAQVPLQRAAQPLPKAARKQAGSHGHGCGQPNITVLTTSNSRRSTSQVIHEHKNTRKKNAIFLYILLSFFPHFMFLCTRWKSPVTSCIIASPCAGSCKTQATSFGKLHRWNAVSLSQRQRFLEPTNPSWVYDRLCKKVNTNGLFFFSFFPLANRKLPPKTQFQRIQNISEVGCKTEQTA